MKMKGRTLSIGTWGMLLGLSAQAALLVTAVQEAGLRPPDNVTELWSAYDDQIRNDPLNVEWLSTWEEDGITISQVRYDLGELVGSQRTANAKIAAFYAYPTGATNLPGMVEIHGGGQRAKTRHAVYWARQGYATISINWGGLPLLDGQPNTDWDGLPAGFSREGVTNATHQTVVDPNVYADGSTLFAEPHPMNSSYILNSMAARRAITFLTEQSNVNTNPIGVTGHSMGGQTTVMTATDSRISCITPSVGGVGNRYEDLWGLPGSGKNMSTADFEMYSRTASPKAYWPLIQCPTLFLEAVNDFHADYDYLIPNMKSQPAEVEQQLAIAPHQNHSFNIEADASRPLWQKTHLTDTFDFPARSVAELDLDEPDKIPTFRVWPDESTDHAIVSVDIYYGYNRDPQNRFWRDAQAVDVGTHWEGKCPVFSTEEPLFAHAIITYDIGFALDMPYGDPAEEFSVASECYVAYPDDLTTNGVIATEGNKRLIDDFSRGFHDWYQDNPDKLTKWEYWTSKLVDPSWEGPYGGELVVDVETSAANNILGVVLLSEWYERDNTKFFATKVLEESGPNQISFKLSDFSNVNGDPLTSWGLVRKLGLMPGNIAAENNLQEWTGAVPTFTYVRWAGGDYTDPEVFEAEDAVIASGSITASASASGSAYVDGGGGFNLTWTVDVTEAGAKDLIFKIAAPSSTRAMGVYVNDSAVGVVSSSSSAWSLESVTATLLSGSNTIELRDSVGTMEPNVDYLQIKDSTPPTPNPATFAVAPEADSSTAISMMAATGSDESGPVEYLFTETSGNSGGNDSGWSTSASYTNSGLSASTEYTYTVTLRDSFGNTGSASSAESATTHSSGGIQAEDFTTGMIQDYYKPEIYESRLDDTGRWYNSDSTLPWTQLGGVAQNSGTNAAAEYPLYSGFIGGGGGTNNQLTFSFDYSVAAGDTLYAHLWGLTGEAGTAHVGSFFDLGVANGDGALISSASTTTKTIYNLTDGATSGGTAASAISGPLTGSGTFTTNINLFDLNMPGVNTAADLGWYVIQFAKDEDGLTGITTIDNLSLTASYKAPSGYRGWLGGYGLTGDDALRDADPDGDGVSNLMEYALGGDPVNGARYGTAPNLIADAADSVDFVHVRRVDALSYITYALAMTDDLVNEPWTTNAGDTIVDYGPETNGFDTVIIRISTVDQPKRFFKLLVEEQ